MELETQEPVLRMVEQWMEVAGSLMAPLGPERAIGCLALGFLLYELDEPSWMKSRKLGFCYLQLNTILTGTRHVLLFFETHQKPIGVDSATSPLLVVRLAVMFWAAKNTSVMSTTMPKRWWALLHHFTTCKPVSHTPHPQRRSGK